MKSGFVYIVGAGPGDPDLITVKGRRCVRRADVILHDRLIHPGVLAEARPKAILIDAEHLQTREPQVRNYPWLEKSEPTFADAIAEVHTLIGRKRTL